RSKKRGIGAGRVAKDRVPRDVEEIGLAMLEAAAHGSLSLVETQRVPEVPWKTGDEPGGPDDVVAERHDGRDYHRGLARCQRATAAGNRSRSALSTDRYIAPPTAGAIRSRDGAAGGRYRNDRSPSSPRRAGAGSERRLCSPEYLSDVRAEVRGAVEREYPVHPAVGVYVHIPFCTYHCTFCFYATRTGADLDQKRRYVA